MPSGKHEARRDVSQQTACESRTDACTINMQKLSEGDVKSNLSALPADRPETVREQRWRDGSHGSLEHTDERRREGGGGGMARREYVFCCSGALGESIADILEALCRKNKGISQGPATSGQRAALCSNAPQTPRELTPPIC